MGRGVRAAIISFGVFTAVSLTKLAAEALSRLFGDVH
jgi:hypothetical protein